MTFRAKFIVACLVFLSYLALGQSTSQSVTVPVTLDHNRIIIDVYLAMPDGSKTRVRGWVDNGNDEMWITEDLATKLNLPLTGETREAGGMKTRMANPPKQLWIADMAVKVDAKQARAVIGRESIAPGSSAKINLPATVLRNYDVLVDYPNRELTLAVPGTLHFQGAKSKAFINPANGLIQVPAVVGRTKQKLGLDLGAPLTFFPETTLKEWIKNNPKWPHMRGAVGPANLWGLEDEPSWTVARLSKIQFGATLLTNVLAASFPRNEIGEFEKRAAIPNSGVMGADAFLNFRVGLDYAHETVYLDRTSKFNFPEMDVVGLVLRPEADGRYTIIGVAEFRGKSSVPEVQKGDVLLTAGGGRVTGATMGQVWSLLSGSPGSVRTLTVDREGKQITVEAKVRSFLATKGSGNERRGRPAKKPK